MEERRRRVRGLNIEWNSSLPPPDFIDTIYEMERIDEGGSILNCFTIGLVLQEDIRYTLQMYQGKRQPNKENAPENETEEEKVEEVEEEEGSKRKKRRKQAEVEEEIMNKEKSNIPREKQSTHTNTKETLYMNDDTSENGDSERGDSENGEKEETEVKEGNRVMTTKRVHRRVMWKPKSKTRKSSLRNYYGPFFLFKKLKVVNRPKEIYRFAKEQERMPTEFEKLKETIFEDDTYKLQHFFVEMANSIWNSNFNDPLPKYVQHAIAHEKRERYSSLVIQTINLYHMDLKELEDIKNSLTNTDLHKTILTGHTRSPYSCYPVLSAAEMLQFPPLVVNRTIEILQSLNLYRTPRVKKRNKTKETNGDNDNNNNDYE